MATLGGQIVFDISGNSLIPAPQTLEFLGASFAAKSVRWWQVRGKRPVEIVESSRDAEAKTLVHRASPVPKQAKQICRILELASDQNRPIWVEGDSEAENRESEDSKGALLASDHPRMFTWLIATRSRRGVLEVVLEADRNGLSSRDREIYLRSLHLLREDLHRTMLNVPEPIRATPIQVLEAAQVHRNAEQSTDNAIAALTELSTILELARNETIQKVQAQLLMLVGSRFDTLQANQMLAKSLHQLLDSHGFRIRCPECGAPAIMRCLAAGNSASGSFVFDHVLPQGRTFHGGRSSVPMLEVVAKSARLA